MTFEDPIEYFIEGVNQSQIKPEIGYDFATGLRHILRQDPDIIMVGEIRDLETAEMAVQAALTGHLVLSTLHTQDAAGTLARLQHMGVPSYHVAASVRLIVAQRLLRRLCPRCRRPVSAYFSSTSTWKEPDTIVARPPRPAGAPAGGAGGGLYWAVTV